MSGIEDNLKRDDSIIDVLILEPDNNKINKKKLNSIL